MSTGDSFAVTPATRVNVNTGDEHMARIARELAALLRGPAPAANGASTRAALDVAVSADTTPVGQVYLTLDGSSLRFGEEGYALTVSRERVTIAASRPAGLFYGVQSLRQLLPSSVEHPGPVAKAVTIPSLRVEDAPRFTWRGMMLDVSRHFLPPADVKRFIDLISLHKLNRLHLHLADDQGWRIEIKSWPNLAIHGGSTAVGGGAGGFYTQADYADIVEYARRRFVMVVPEIDMPAHTNAALASYPGLNCDGVAPPLYTGVEVGFSALCVDADITYRFIEDVIRELSAITPGPFLHIGGDEVKKLSDAQYTRFIERVQSVVQSHGKLMVGWDEISSTRLLPTSVVQFWRPNVSPRAAVAQGVRIIVSPYNKVYLDMKYDSATVLGLSWAGNIEVRDAYAWDPAMLHADLPESSVLGVEAPLWSETVVDIRDFERMAFPRLAAVAEIGWSPARARVWEEFRLRLAAQAPRWSALGINFYRSPQIPWREAR